VIAVGRKNNFSDIIVTIKRQNYKLKWWYVFLILIFDQKLLMNDSGPPFKIKPGISRNLKKDWQQLNKSACKSQSVGF